MRDHRTERSTRGSNQVQAKESAAQTAEAPTDTDAMPGVAVTSLSALQAAGGNIQMAAWAGAVQRHGDGGGGTDHVHAAAAHGISGGGSTMPHADAIQGAFGKHDVSNVQAHVGGKAAEASSAMGAEAYASGNNVAFKDTPSLHTAAHEAAHVVQQSAGVSLAGGVGKVGDSYEQHADAVADAVVSGKSAEPILDKMAGGGGGGAVQAKAVQRAPGGPTRAPTSGASGGTSRSSGPTTADPEAEWRTFVDTIRDAGAKTAASGLTGDDREKFKALNPASQRTFGAIPAALRAEFFGLQPWPDQNAVTVMVANPTHLAQYAGLAPANREGYRKLTPDERGDMVTTDATYVATLLTDEAKLNEWRTWRNVNVIKDIPAVCAALSVDPDDPLKFAEEVGQLSIGQAGERLRRLVTETGFEQPTHREESLKDVRDRVKGGTEAWEAMGQAKDTWVLKGKLAKGDAGYRSVPLMKAVPYISMIMHSTISTDFRDALLEENGTNDAAHKAKWASDKRSLALPYFLKWKEAGGVFDPKSHTPNAEIKGRGAAGAYWMYGGDKAALVDPAKSGQDIVQMCAIEESPEYNHGFCIVEIPKSDPGLDSKVRRPTMWDGLQFDQFAAVTDPSQCFGVTSGGSPEVVIASTTISAVTILRKL